jgi:hypothetical protein
MVVQVQQITVEFIKRNRVPGGKSTRIDVDRNGKPFAAMWTFRVKGEEHPWHVKPTDNAHGEHEVFWKSDGGLTAAKARIVELARAV